MTHGTVPCVTEPSPVSPCVTSNNRPKNNVVQNKQYEDAARKAGLNPKDPDVKDLLREVHQYIRRNKLNLGWKDLVDLIKDFK